MFGRALPSAAGASIHGPHGACSSDELERHGLGMLPLLVGQIKTEHPASIWHARTHELMKSTPASYLHARIEGHGL
jgi:hypothetical protein